MKRYGVVNQAVNVSMQIVWKPADRPARAVLAALQGGAGKNGEIEIGWYEEGPPTDRPPYEPPTMAEIESVPLNGLRLASLFSGCGGSCLGFRLAGFRTVWANEFTPAARAVYRLNHPGVFLDGRDVRQVQPEHILDAAGLRPGELDVMEGSPPCAAYSQIGRRHKAWGQVRSYSGTRQRTDDLFGEYARLLAGVRPRSFVAENVSGLVKGAAKGHFLEALAALRGAGYRVAAATLDAQWLGVPQARPRLLFVGVRNDLAGEPTFPQPLPWRWSLRDALPPEHYDPPAGGPDEATTRRKFTIGELRRVCGFPADFQLVGSYAQQWERLGRAVPPLMAYQIARTIRDEVLQCRWKAN